MAVELDPTDCEIGFGAESMERRALALIAQVRDNGHGQNKVCEREVSPLPYGCWNERNERSPYARYGADRWCNSCIAYAALNGTLPRPSLTIDGAAEQLRIGAG